MIVGSASEVLGCSATCATVVASIWLSGMLAVREPAR